METNFYDLIHKSLMRNYDGVLLIKRKPGGEYETLTGGEILTRLKQFRDALLDSNFDEDDNVMVALYLEEGLIEGVLACMSLGLTAVIPPPGGSGRQFLNAIRQQHVHFMFTHDETSALSRFMVNLFGCETLSLKEPEYLGTDPIDFTIEEVESFDVAMISYHSSNNGDLRAVFKTHENMKAQHKVLKNTFESWAGQLDYPLVPNTILHNLAFGICTLFPDVDKHHPHLYDVAKITEQIFDMKVQTMLGNSKFYRQIIDSLNGSKRIFPFLREIGIGGAPVPENLLKRMKDVFRISKPYILYGCIEAEPIAIRRFDGKFSNPILGYNVGKPHENIELEIKKTWQIVLPKGLQDVGEIKVRGPHVSLRPGEEWHSTGDFGYLAPDGSLMLTARIGNEAVFDGFQHYQIEHTLYFEFDLVSVGAVYKDRGFKVYYIGDVEETVIMQRCEERFPKGLIIGVTKKSKLPMDRRHNAKIIYDSLS